MSEIGLQTYFVFLVLVATKISSSKKNQRWLVDGEIALWAR